MNPYAQQVVNVAAYATAATVAVLGVSMLVAVALPKSVGLANVLSAGIVGAILVTGDYGNA